MFDAIASDVRLAVRGLRRQWGFSVAAVATVALGIGASTAIFSVAYGVSLRPLPYAEPDRLVRIYESNPLSGKLEQDVSEGSFHDWRQATRSLDGFALVSPVSARTLAGTERRRIATRSVSPVFFDVLGVRPMLGRSFRPEPEFTGSIDEVVLTFEGWQRLFGGAHGALGDTITFTGVGDDDVFRVVGVLPEGFRFDARVDAWLPNVVQLPIRPIVRNWRYDQMVARLAPGVTLERARSELAGVSARIAREFPASNAGWTVSVESLHDSIVGNFGRATSLLLAAVALVLLVACVNVGGLFLARAVARERETAVRTALGAGSWRLARLWLADAALLSTLGGGLGVLLAWLAVALLRRAAPAGVPRVEAIGIDRPVLLVAVVATVLAIGIFTMAPLGLSRRRPVAQSLLAGSSGAGDSRRRQAARGGLMIAQCAGAAALVVLAAMLTRSLVRLMAVDLGWEPQGVLSLEASPTVPREIRRPWFARVDWSDRVIARLEALPGIDRAAVATQIPLSDSYPSTLARGRGRAAIDPMRWPGVEAKVTDGYFALMGIGLRDGRLFNDGDRFAEPFINGPTRADHGVAIVSAQTARTLWPGQSAIGQALWLPDIDNVPWREVVGVVDDIQFHSVGETPALHVFLPWTQSSSGASPKVLVRSSGRSDAAAMAAPVREALRAVEPGAVVDDVVTLGALVSRATAQPRFTSRLVVAFGMVALVLAAVGIYGTLAYVVLARRREIGVRIALGASRAGILAHVIRGGVLPAIGGGAIGLGVAVFVARTFRVLLFDVEPLDVPSLTTGAATLLAVVLVAALEPARRAATVEPVQALRSE